MLKLRNKNSKKIEKRKKKSIEYIDTQLDFIKEYFGRKLLYLFNVTI